jgi:hypothetical protein
MSAQAQQQPNEARFIAKQAFIYGFPIVDATKGYTRVRGGFDFVNHFVIAVGRGRLA